MDIISTLFAEQLTRTFEVLVIIIFLVNLEDKNTNICNMCNSSLCSSTLWHRVNALIMSFQAMMRNTPNKQCNASDQFDCQRLSFQRNSQ